jgi:hypothetical protein
LLVPQAAVPDREAWDAWTPLEVAARLSTVEIPWAVAGGWAVDLYVGGEPRHHTDIEIVIDRHSLSAVRAALPTLTWFGVGSGQITPILDEPGGVHQTWGWDQSCGCWRVDVIRERWEGDYWVYRRDPTVRCPLTEAIEQTEEGIPFLAPELVLLFKAKAHRAKDESDFARLLPLLSPDRKSWLAAALRAAHPGIAGCRSSPADDRYLQSAGESALIRR